MTNRNARQQKQWAPFLLSFTAILSGADARVDLTSLALAALPSLLREWTILRTIGILQLWGTDVSIRAHVSFALISHPSTVTITQIPKPDTELADWLWFSGAVIPNTGDEPTHIAIPFDIAAMRKQREAERRYSFVMHSASAGASGFSINGHFLLGQR